MNKTIQEDYYVCLDCGKTVLTLNKDGECNECTQEAEE